MKTCLALMIFGLARSIGLGQGCLDFENICLFQTPDPTGGNRLVYDVGSPLDPVHGVKLIGTQYVAELYAGADVSSLTPITASISPFRSTTSSSPGAWNFLTIGGQKNDCLALLGPAGSTLTLQVRVWDMSQFATYEAAVGHGKTGASNPFQFTISTQVNACMEGLQAFALVPEPAALAGLIGLAVLVVVRQKGRK